MEGYVRDRKVSSVHSCKRRAQCASLAMHSTTSPVLRCSNKHYSRLTLTGIAHFRLHAQGEEDQRRHKFTGVEKFLKERCPSTWLMWHLNEFEPFGFGDDE